MWSETARTDRGEANLGRQSKSVPSSAFPTILFLLLPDRYDKIIVWTDQSFNRMSSVMVGRMATYVRESAGFARGTSIKAHSHGIRRS